MTVERDRILLRSFVRSWPENTFAVARGGTCIETTRAAVAVLRRLRLDARPLPVAVHAVNARAELLHVRRVPVEQWPSDAWSVGIVDLGVQSYDSLDEPSRRTGWAGHLIVAGPDWLLDLTAQQFSRPDHDLHIDGAMLGLSLRFDPTREGTRVALPRGGAIRYLPQPWHKAWRSTPAWRQDIDPRRLAAFVEVVRRRADRRTLRLVGASE